MQGKLRGLGYLCAHDWQPNKEQGLAVWPPWTSQHLFICLPTEFSHGICKIAYLVPVFKITGQEASVASGVSYREGRKAETTR